MNDRTAPPAGTAVPESIAQTDKWNALIAKAKALAPPPDAETLLEMADRHLWHKRVIGPDPKFAVFVHPSGWEIHHCGHPTANWPYFLLAPGRGEQIMSHNGRGFRSVEVCRDVVTKIVAGTYRITTENCSPNIATVENVTAFGELIGADDRPVVAKPMNILRKLRDDAGQALAEFAMILPIFVLVGMMLVDLQWLTRDAAAIEFIANETARCEAIKSFACPVTKDYATDQAANMRLSTDGAHLQVSAPSCTPSACNVTINYQFKPLGVWFPAITIHRTGTASVAP